MREGKIKVVEVNGRWRIPYSEIDCCLAVEGLNKWRPTLEFHQRERRNWRGSWTRERIGKLSEEWV